MNSWVADRKLVVFEVRILEMKPHENHIAAGIVISTNIVDVMEHIRLGQDSKRTYHFMGFRFLTAIQA